MTVVPAASRSGRGRPRAPPVLTVAANWASLGIACGRSALPPHIGQATSASALANVRATSKLAPQALRR